MKILLLAGLVFFTAPLHADGLTATIKEPAKMEFTRGKGSLLLKAGTVVEVVSQDGETLAVVYRNIAGFVPAAKTDFKGEVPKAPLTAKPETAAGSKPDGKNIAAAAGGAPEPVKVQTNATAPREDPTTNYGKMVKKARESEEKHRENLVEPVDSISGAKK